MIVAPIEWSLNFQIRGVIISRINFILAPFESSPRPVQDFLQFPRGGELKYLGGRSKKRKVSLREEDGMEIKQFNRGVNEGEFEIFRERGSSNIVIGFVINHLCTLASDFSSWKFSERKGGVWI